jgi:hypothetical protein
MDGLSGKDSELADKLKALQSLEDRVRQLE